MTDTYLDSEIRLNSTGKFNADWHTPRSMYMCQLKYAYVSLSCLIKSQLSRCGLFLHLHVSRHVPRTRDDDDVSWSHKYPRTREFSARFGEIMLSTAFADSLAYVAGVTWQREKESETRHRNSDSVSIRQRSVTFSVVRVSQRLERRDAPRRFYRPRPGGAQTWTHHWLLKGCGTSRTRRERRRLQDKLTCVTTRTHTARGDFFFFFFFNERIMRIDESRVTVTSRKTLSGTGFTVPVFHVQLVD